MIWAESRCGQHRVGVVCSLERLHSAVDKISMMMMIMVVGVFSQHAVWSLPQLFRQGVLYESKNYFHTPVLYDE